MYNLEYRLENATEEEKLESILDKYNQLEGIHPFSVGDGHRGRILVDIGKFLSGSAHYKGYYRQKILTSSFKFREL